MRRRPPISTRTDTLFPYTTLFRSSLRSSKEEGQSNFNNPGTVFVGAGADFDLSPQVRVSTNLNHLWFQNTATLQVLRSEGSIPKDIGWELSLAGIWRPRATQNIVDRLRAAVLVPGQGFKDLFEHKEPDDLYLRSDEHPSELQYQRRL